MNALHWHLTDAQSTPYDSTVHPNLKLGGFSEKAVYTPADIKEIVEYLLLSISCVIQDPPQFAPDSVSVFMTVMYSFTGAGMLVCGACRS
jgi:hypothetical protein